MNGSQAATKKVVDRVCHMQIVPANAVGASSFNGETYYFCSRGCETTFDAAPDTYARVIATEPAGSCCSTRHSCC